MNDEFTSITETKESVVKRTEEIIVTDVKMPFKSVFALTFKFWLSGLVLGIVVSAIILGVGLAVGLLSIGLNMAVLVM